MALGKLEAVGTYSIFESLQLNASSLSRVQILTDQAASIDPDNLLLSARGYCRVREGAEDCQYPGGPPKVPVFQNGPWDD
jgi:hypothetical protein